MREILRESGREIVDDDDAVPPREQEINEMGANEAGTAGDQDAHLERVHHPRNGRPVLGRSVRMLSVREAVELEAELTYRVGAHDAPRVDHDRAAHHLPDSRVIE